MVDSNDIITNKSPSGFSYLIQPTTPCIFGTEDYDDEPINDDEFFVTAGGIVHSCPNIYELSIDNHYKHRKLQSCEHFITSSSSMNNTLNIYNTEVDRYSIIPRFQPISPTLSTDSINSEIELYKKRHAIGLFQRDDCTISFLSNVSKSDNYLLLISLRNHQISLSTSFDSIKRSRSYDSSIGQTVSSIFL